MIRLLVFRPMTTVADRANFDKRGGKLHDMIAAMQNPQADGINAAHGKSS
jgi:hypothetical protein